MRNFNKIKRYYLISYKYKWAGGEGYGSIILPLWSKFKARDLEMTKEKINQFIIDESGAEDASRGTIITNVVEI